MLPKKHRLSKYAEVNTTAAKGRSFFSQSFILKFLSNLKNIDPRIAVVVSNKVSKSAVVRNRLKRIIRDEIHKHILKIRSGNYVIILKRSAININPEQLRNELFQALLKGKILNND